MAPLAGLRIVDGVEGPLAPLTRYLAELGALVERIAPATGDPAFDLAANCGKLLRPAADLSLADAIVAGPGSRADLAQLRTARPALVTMVVSDFGTDTSLSTWHATDPVLHALSGELSRSGIRGRQPLLPPGRLAYECAAAQGAFVLASALYRALRTGEGDHIDFSALDGAVQALDPGYGISGSATLGKPAHLLSRDRPVRGFHYPVLRCSNGFVRICLLAKRQWQGMFRWMGEPPEFASPEFEKTAVRYKSPTLLPAIAAFFAQRTRAELEDEARAFGVPLSAVLTFEEALGAQHFRERKTFVAETLPDGGEVRVPGGVLTIDGERTGGAAPAHQDVVWPHPTEKGLQPFAGLRVLDLGVIVVGAEQGRLLADGGADVVKVESRAYPDGNRQSYLSYGMSVSFAAGHRNKRSLGINLRDPAGREIFLDLVRKADVVLSNFKPGTMESLKLGYQELAAANPAVIVAESSAFGSTGPWAGRMGYGPLVRAATGLTMAWRYPDDPEGFSDTVTIYPDHVAARVGALGVVALLIRRLRTGGGGLAGVAQAEVMLSQFGAEVVRASSGQPVSEPRDWPWNVYSTAGDDDWCVVTVRHDQDWGRLATILKVDDPRLADREGRLAHRRLIDKALTLWLGGRSADEAMRELQRAGVPAAKMLRVGDLPDFDYFVERGFYRVEGHPFLKEDVIAERWSAKRNGAVEAPAGPAPLMGEHSLEIIRDWLGAATDPDALVANGVLEPTDEMVWAEARAGGRDQLNHQQQQER